MQFLTCFKYNFLHTLESPKWVTILATQPDAEEYPFFIRTVRISVPPMDALGAMMVMSELQRRACYHSPLQSHSILACRIQTLSAL